MRAAGPDRAGRPRGGVRGVRGGRHRRPWPPSCRRCAGVHGIGDLDEASPRLGGSAAEATWDTESLAHHRRYPGEGLVAQERLAGGGGRAARLPGPGRAPGSKRAMRRRLSPPRKARSSGSGRSSEADPAWKAIRPRWLRGNLNEGFRLTFPPTGRALRTGRGRPAGLAAGGRAGPRPRHRNGGLRPPASAAGQPEARALAQRAQVDQLLDFSELVEGDFVVHLQHGIALFRGLPTLDTAQGRRR